MTAARCKKQCKTSFAGLQASRTPTLAALRASPWQARPCSLAALRCPPTSPPECRRARPHPPSSRHLARDRARRQRRCAYNACACDGRRWACTVTADGCVQRALHGAHSQAARHLAGDSGPQAWSSSFHLAGPRASPPPTESCRRRARRGPARVPPQCGPHEVPVSINVN